MNWELGVQYAHDVVDGKINVCRNVRASCQRFLDPPVAKLAAGPLAR